MIMIDNTFDFGEIVYLKTDIFQLPRIVCEIVCREKGNYAYLISQGEDGPLEANEFELSNERDEALRLSYPQQNSNDLLEDDED